MATDTNVFTLTLTDEQQAATAGTPFAGEAGSFSRDGVVTHFTTEKTDAGHVYTITILERPFYVPQDEIQKYITDMLTAPPAPPPGGEGESESKTSASAHTTAASASTASHEGKRAPVLEHRPERRER